MSPVPTVMNLAFCFVKAGAGATENSVMAVSAVAIKVRFFTVSLLRLVE